MSVVELPEEIKEVVAYTAAHWPKRVDARELLRELDTLAKRVYLFAKTESDK